MKHLNYKIVMMLAILVNKVLIVLTERLKPALTETLQTKKAKKSFPNADLSPHIAIKGTKGVANTPQSS
jgi:hypothetical protein